MYQQRERLIARRARTVAVAGIVEVDLVVALDQAGEDGVVGAETVRVFRAARVGQRDHSVAIGEGGSGFTQDSRRNSSTKLT